MRLNGRSETVWPWRVSSLSLTKVMNVDETLKVFSLFLGCNSSGVWNWSRQARQTQQKSFGSWRRHKEFHIFHKIEGFSGEILLLFAYFYFTFLCVFLCILLLVWLCLRICTISLINVLFRRLTGFYQFLFFVFVEWIVNEIAGGWSEAVRWVLHSWAESCRSEHWMCGSQPYGHLLEHLCLLLFSGVWSAEDGSDLTDGRQLLRLTRRHLHRSVSDHHLLSVYFNNNEGWRWVRIYCWHSFCSFSVGW